MPTARTPKNIVAIRRPVAVGDQLMIPVTVTRTAQGASTRERVGGTEVTIRIPGYSYPITVPLAYLTGEAEAD